MYPKPNYKELLAQPSVQALIVVNMVPLFGVLFFSWSLFAVIYLYWLENVIIGIFNVLRMSRAEGALDPTQQVKRNNNPYMRGSRIVLVVFFCFHYGIFTLVHGAFVVAIFGPFDLDVYTFLFGAIALIASHGVSYYSNFIGKGEYKNVNEAMLFMQPYKRIVTLHISIIFGGFLAQLIGTPLLALVFFIFFKTWIDLLAHAREHAPLHPDKGTLLFQQYFQMFLHLQSIRKQKKALLKEVEEGTQ